SRADRRPEEKQTPSATTAWPWPLRLPAPPRPRPSRSVGPTRSPCHIPVFSASCSACARPVAIDKIYLVGFMTAGKTTVARALGARLGWRAEDVDELIEARERKPIAEIFSRHGEPYFRNVEREILRLLLPIRHAVVATGGGTFMDPENRLTINRDGLSIWLDV